MALGIGGNGDLKVGDGTNAAHQIGGILVTLRMRFKALADAAGRIAADALGFAGAAPRPGMTTDEVDRIGHEYLFDHGAYPSTLGYRGFPKSLCPSLNEVICHGIPDSTVIEDGDMVMAALFAIQDAARTGAWLLSLAGSPDSLKARLLHAPTREFLQLDVPPRPELALAASDRHVFVTDTRAGETFVYDIPTPQKQR